MNKKDWKRPLFEEDLEYGFGNLSRTMNPEVFDMFEKLFLKRVKEIKAFYAEIIITLCKMNKPTAYWDINDMKTDKLSERNLVLGKVVAMSQELEHVLPMVQALWKERNEHFTNTLEGKNEATGLNTEIDTYEKFMDILDEKWNMDYGKVRVENGIIQIHTGGWFENEEVLPQLEMTMFWYMRWKKSTRGGHYYLELKDFDLKDQSVNEKEEPPKED